MSEARTGAGGTGPIFVVGSLGSGSTLLRLMLDSHERIAIPQETGFLRLALAQQWVPYWNFGGEWHTRVGLTDADRDARLGEFYGGIFSEYAAARGKQRWGEKTPFHVWHVDLACRLFPDATFVGIVRHPGGVASSLHGRFRYGWRKGVNHWVRTNKRLVHEMTARPDRFTLVRYEDLVAEPERVMRALLDRLGEPWSPDVLAHHEVQPRSGAPRVVEGHTRSDAPIDTDRVERWTSELDDTARRHLAKQRTTALAEFLGYDVADPARREPLSEDWSGVTTGQQLVVRRASHGAAIDWSVVPQPALENQLFRPPAPRRPRHGRRAVVRRRAAPPPAEPSAARKLVDRLPARLHRRVHDYRRHR